MGRNQRKKGRQRGPTVSWRGCVAQEVISGLLSAVGLQFTEVELRRRYGSHPMVTFTSPFELVLGTKPGTVAGRA